MFTVLKKSYIRIPLMIFLSVTALFLFSLLCSSKADAKTIVIKTPEQMRNINWKNKGFGPGNTYKLGNGMDLATNLPSGEHGTCLLTKGKFVIDLNGNTLQSTDSEQTVIDIRGANVILKDSKANTASRNRPSVRSYGLGAVQITSGKLTVKNGYYCGASNGQNNPVGLHAGGGTCTVLGGIFDGDHIGASVGGANMRINGGVFKTSYMFGLMLMGNGKIKITNGSFINTKSGSFNPTFALGAYNLNGSSYNFNSWLAGGASFNPSIMTYYWNGTSTDTSPYPTKMVGTKYVQMPYTYPYAVAYTGNSGYEAVTLKVSAKGIAPEGTSIKSLKPGKNAVKVKWKKKTNKVSGYIVGYSTSAKFKKSKSVTIKGNKNTSKKITKLKSGKKYYFRVRTYRLFNGKKFCSGWSKVKSKKAK